MFHLYQRPNCPEEMTGQRKRIHLPIQTTNRILGNLRRSIVAVVGHQILAQPGALELSVRIAGVIDLIDAGKLGEMIADIEGLIVVRRVLVIDERNAAGRLLVDDIAEQQIVVREHNGTAEDSEAREQRLELGAQSANGGQSDGADSKRNKRNK